MPASRGPEASQSKSSSKLWKIQLYMLSSMLLKSVQVQQNWVLVFQERSPGMSWKDVLYWLLLMLNICNTTIPLAGPWQVTYDVMCDFFTMFDCGFVQGTLGHSLPSLIVMVTQKSMWMNFWRDACYWKGSNLSWQTRTICVAQTLFPPCWITKWSMFVRQSCLKLSTGSSTFLHDLVFLPYQVDIESSIAYELCINMKLYPLSITLPS